MKGAECVMFETNIVKRSTLWGVDHNHWKKRRSGRSSVVRCQAWLTALICVTNAGVLPDFAGLCLACLALLSCYSKVIGESNHADIK
jgi:hypothetical protein